MILNNYAAEAAEVTQQIKLEFPNLFGGTEILYYRGFKIFGVPIYWYGIIIAVGIVLAYLYAMKRCEKDFGLSRDRSFDVIFASIIGGFIGARVYYCVFTTLNPNSPTNYDLITTFTQIRDGGLAIYGGIIFALLTGLLFSKIRKVKFFAICDLAALGFLIGQTIGRWGNFVNQEAYGSACAKDWLFAMKGTLIRANGISGVVHPCFLYESAWCLLGFIFLHIYSKKLRTFDGEIILLYAAWYGFGRFFIENLRTDSLMAGSLRVSQLVAAVSFAVAMALFVTFKILTKKKNIPLYVNTDESRELLEAERKAEAEKAAKKSAEKTPAAPSILGDDEPENPEENEEKSEENTAEIPAENPPENSPENPDKKPSEIPEEKPADAEEKSGEKPDEIPPENPPENPEEKPSENTEENTQKGEQNGTDN